VEAGLLTTPWHGMAWRKRCLEGSGAWDGSFSPTASTWQPPSEAEQQGADARYLLPPHAR